MALWSFPLLLLGVWPPTPILSSLACTCPQPLPQPCGRAAAQLTRRPAGDNAYDNHGANCPFLLLQPQAQNQLAISAASSVVSSSRTERVFPAMRAPTCGRWV